MRNTNNNNFSSEVDSRIRYANIHISISIIVVYKLFNSDFNKNNIVFLKVGITRASNQTNDNNNNTTMPFLQTLADLIMLPPEL